MSEIRVENIIGETGLDAVKFTKGVNVTGIVTATSFAGSGAALTGTGKFFKLFPLLKLMLLQHHHNLMLLYQDYQPQ